jgi:hypothetical protein
MTLSDGSTSVLLNGAIYHFLELRKALETRDCVFPSGLTVAGRCLERLLRKLAARRISERVAAGRKRGFNVPARAWMTTRWRDDVADTFGNARLAADGWLTAGSLPPATIGCKGGEPATVVRLRPGTLVSGVL